MKENIICLHCKSLVESTDVSEDLKCPKCGHDICEENINE